MERTQQSIGVVKHLVTKAVAAENPAEEIVAAIEKVAEGAKALLESRLTLRTIALLIRDELGPGGPGSLSTIEAVLKAAANLDKTCLKKE
jgi:hypothetical protein